MPRPSLAALLQETTSWFRTPLGRVWPDITYHLEALGQCYQVEMADDENILDRYVYTKAEVLAVDNRLLEALDYLLLSKQRTTTWMRLATTYAHWQCPGLRLPLTLPGTGACQSYLGALKGIYKDSPDGMVHAEATSYTLTTLLSGLEVVNVVTADFEQIPVAWMEQHFPGSVHRIHVAISLDCSFEQTAVQAYAIADAQPSVWLPTDLALP